MSKIFLIIGAGIIFILITYATFLLWQLHLQKKSFQKARLKRQTKLQQSCLIIANAMLSEQCNFSEGVIRLKMLLDPLGKNLKPYPAMQRLHSTVMDMPTHEKRYQLKKNERLRLDNIREKSEMENYQQIKQELPLLIQSLKQKERL